MKSLRLNITLLLAILWLLFPDPSLSACYYPDATCCGQGYACLSNSLCMATGDEIKKTGATLYVRGSCTDPTWRSSACPLFCINPDPPNSDNLAGGQEIVKCPNTALDMYYCIDYNMENVNCSAQHNVLIFQGTPTALTTIGVTATTEITSSTSTISSATANSSSVVTTTGYSTTTGNPSPTASKVAAETTTPAAAEPKPAQNHTGVIAGATVGGFVALAAIAGLVYFFRRRGKRQRGQRLGLTPSSQLSSGDVYMTDMSVTRQSIPSKQGARALYEAPGAESRTYELAG
ncbi:hypothetical protein CNMCM5793_009096 [Aspergillus hiratsukae]|uniref:Mid2 domain-containing protein n=1 Tax=Aspergillus hiratsukae TaxID=1194566 RepID=A0A8H6UF74_9EURO|nr:hypothetical protein CNMCM5793_009096 [Aspergillus hiratsukae]KAF7163219.1 hypothetical protein CNMCM6106_000207 [Aspergillus hiratsukae]